MGAVDMETGRQDLGDREMGRRMGRKSQREKTRKGTGQRQR